MVGSGLARPDFTKGSLQKKTSYLVTLSKKVGGGQDQITISGPLEIVTSLEGGRGTKNQCHYFYSHFMWYFKNKMVLNQTLEPQIFPVPYNTEIDVN